MGYTHYWYKIPNIKEEVFSEFAADCKKIIDFCNENGLKLGDGSGENDPIINDQEVCFNGLSNCGHDKKNLGITWPANNAGGISDNPVTTGDWFGGQLLLMRSCGGDCSHETFKIERIYQPYENENSYQSKYFNFCKTAYKPYDIAVTACLIALKHYLKSDVLINSDGDLNDWQDGALICDKLFNYGLSFNFDDTNHIKADPEPKLTLSDIENGREKLLKEYDYLIPDMKPGGVNAAKNIRIELKRNFPGVKFSVKSDYNSVDIYYKKDFKEVEKLKNIVMKYECGYFDGMIDSYHYKPSIFNKIFGEAHYVFTCCGY